MVFSVVNLGPISDAKIELGDFTIVCGKNNNGKTYLTYTLATFLSTIKRNLTVPITDALADKLIDNGELNINLENHIDDYIEAVKSILPRFRESLPRFLAMPSSRFDDFNIDVFLTHDEVCEKLALPPNSLNQTSIQITSTASIIIERSSNSTDASIRLDNRGETLPPRRQIVNALSFIIGRMMDDVPLSPILPDVFAITCERTGAMLFRSELVDLRFEKYRASDVVARQTRRHGAFNEYQRPVSDELNFVLDMPKVYKRVSAIAKQNPDIIDLLRDISGGEYSIDSETKQVVFSPLARPDLSLQLPESSSTVRSLAELNFYLLHVAKPGELLIFDEPELNLHPHNQRLLARVLAMLVNAGLKIFITTHSDYILRELNALVRLGTYSRNLCGNLLDRYNVPSHAILNDDKMRVYVLQNGIAERVSFNGFTKAFAVPSFDNTIDEFNRLYDDIQSLDFRQ